MLVLKLNHATQMGRGYLVQGTRVYNTFKSVAPTWLANGLTVAHSTTSQHDEWVMNIALASITSI